MKKAIWILSLFLFCSCLPDEYEMDMVYVEGGEFIMGSDEEDADTDESPMRTVQMESFYIGRYEITQKQWKRVMNGKNPSIFKDDDRPVECVSWNDVQIFIKRLNKITGRSFRLPTEKEWEYAAKGGIFGVEDNLNPAEIEKIAWFVENSDSISHRVGELQPNKLGIYDMIGNVHEWCYDVYDSLAYSQDLVNGDVSQNLDSAIRVYRGGSWLSSRKYIRVSNRNKNNVNLRHFCLGFRLAESCNPIE